MFLDVLPVFISTSLSSVLTACNALEGQDMYLHRIGIYRCGRSVVAATCKSKFIKAGNTFL